MPDYSKSKVYTVRCHLDQSLIYVGSTTQALSKRWETTNKNGNEANTYQWLPRHHLIQDINDISNYMKNSRVEIMKNS